MATAPPTVNPDGDSVRRRMRWPVAASSGLAVQAATTGNSAQIALQGQATQCVYISQVEWSYSAAPTGGNLNITGATAGKVKDLDITAAGVGSFQFDPPLAFSPGEAVTITIASGNAAGATAKAACEAWCMQ